MTRHDVIILGGGIIGGALADELARRGRSVCLIERGRMGDEASKAAAGILSAQMDLERPGPLFEFCQLARRLYPGWVRHLERRGGAPIGWHQDGILYAILSAADGRRMAHRMRWQRKLGHRVERWSRAQALRREPSLNPAIREALFFPTEGQLDNVRLMDALSRACRAAGVRVMERTVAMTLELRRNRVNGVRTDRGIIRAPVIVNSLGSWSPLLGSLSLQAPIAPARGQMLAFTAPHDSLRHVVMSEAGYAVQRRDGRLIAGSTVEFVGFDKALTFAGIRTIAAGCARLFTPALLEQCRLIDTWTGLRPCSLDRQPILGATRLKGYYVATGHFRHGILLAPATAKVMAELILTGRSSFDLKPFSLNRFHPTSGKR